jgi:hypothetical protein
MRWFQKLRAGSAVRGKANVQVARIGKEFTDIARELMKGFVETGGFDRNQFAVPDGLRPQFLAKVRIYNEAIILGSLTSKAERDSRYGNLLIAFERLVFPDTQTADGVSRLGQINEAMQNMAELLRSRNGEMRWTQSWLRSIGSEETNAVTLGLFASYWMERHKAISLAIDDIRVLLR